MITKKCRDCDREFTLTDGEIEFYRSKNLSLPARCQQCRDRRKANNSGSVKRTSHTYVNHSRPAKKSLLPLLLCVLGVIAVIFAAGNSELRSMLPWNNGSDIITTTYETTTYLTEQTTLPTEITSASETEYSSISLTEAQTTAPTTVQTTAPTTIQTAAPTTKATTKATTAQVQALHFRSDKLLNEHYEKHGKEMGFASAAEYEAAASAAALSPNALHKLEKEDNDDVYYIESTNEFVIVSTDGYIRTYFYPDRGKEYFDKQ